MTRYFEEDLVEFRRTGGSSIGAGRSVFLCYAREDRSWVDKFTVHMRPYVRQVRLTIWDDAQVGAGEDWHAKIQRKIRSSSAVVLFISKHFLASNYIAASEMPLFLLRRQQRTKLTIFPMHVSPSVWDDVEYRYPNPETGPHVLKLRDIQMVNSEESTLAELSESEQDRVMISVAKKLNGALSDA